MSHIFGLEHSLSGIAGQIGAATGFWTPPPPTVILPPITVDGIPPGGGGGGGTLIPYDAGGGSCNPGPKMVLDPSGNCGAGKWIKKSRRRRRRLATASDIKDLSALKAVLGGGKAFDAWIATRGR